MECGPATVRGLETRLLTRSLAAAVTDDRVGTPRVSSWQPSRTRGELSLHARVLGEGPQGAVAARSVLEGPQGALHLRASPRATISVVRLCPPSFASGFIASPL
jgi:hypothetical protein